MKYMDSISFNTPTGEQITLSVKNIKIGNPKAGVDHRDEYPKESRQLHKSYKGSCSIKVAWQLNNVEMGVVDVDMGEIPVMLKSDVCNLAKLKPQQLIRHGEHESEWGGIFIIKGNERIIRLLQATRRNYPITIKRSSWKTRGINFSDIGVLIRCVREDETSYNNVLHYLNNGTCKLMFSHLKLMAYVPVCLVLKCLMDYSDEILYQHLIRGYEDNQYYAACIQQMLRDLHLEDLHTTAACKHYLGQIFATRFTNLAPGLQNSDITDYILKKRILIHLEAYKEKFDLLIFMIQKLYHCMDGKAKIENIDSVMFQEILTAGK